jgi:hypothetical protein
MLVLYVFIAYLVQCSALHCHRYGPGEGVWLRDPPYWKERDCPTNYAFELNSTRTCLEGRTVYIIGISTARQFGFSIRTLLGGEVISREEQMLSCSKVANENAESCRQNYNGVAMKDLFMNYLDGFDYSERGGFTYFKDPESVASARFANVNEARRFFNEDNLVPDDSCSYGSSSFPSVKACLEKFFEGSRPQGSPSGDAERITLTQRLVCLHTDILIMNVGLIYSIQSAHIDGGRWLREAATAFRDNVVSIFKGAHVFRIEMTETYPSWGQPVLNDLHQAGNQILAEVLGEVMPPRVEGVTGENLSIVA